VDGVPEYFYKIVEDNPKECRATQNYIGPIDSSRKIPLDLRKFAGKNIFVCALGKNGESVQLRDAFTSFEVTLASRVTPELETEPGLLPSEEKIKNLNLDPNQGFKKIRYSLHSLSDTEANCNDLSHFSRSVDISDLRRALLQQGKTLKKYGYFRLCVSSESGPTPHAYSEYIFAMGKRDFVQRIDFLIHNKDLNTQIQDIKIPFESWQFRPSSLFLGWQKDFYFRHKVVSDLKDCKKNTNYSPIENETTIVEFNISKFGSSPFHVCVALSHERSVLASLDEAIISSFGYQNTFAKNGN
jgi:hypothetical protein